MAILTTAYQSWKVPAVKLNIILCKTLYSAGFLSKFWWISQSQNQSQRFYYKKIITIHRMTQRLKPIWIYLSHKFLPLFSVQWLHFDDNSVSTGTSTEAVRPTKATSYKQISLDPLRGLNYLIRPNKSTHKGWHILLYLFNDIYIVFVYFHQVTPSCLLGLDEHNEIVEGDGDHCHVYSPGTTWRSFMHTHPTSQHCVSYFDMLNLIYHWCH